MPLYTEYVVVIVEHEKATKRTTAEAEDHLHQIIRAGLGDPPEERIEIKVHARHIKAD